MPPVGQLRVTFFKKCGVYEDQKIWKLKISDQGFLIFPIFWKKKYFFCLGVRRPKKIGQIPQNCQKSIFVDQNQKKIKTKSCTYAFSSSEKQILVKKKIFLEFFLQIFFNFFSKKWEKVPFPPTKIFVSTLSWLNLSFWTTWLWSRVCGWEKIFRTLRDAVYH